MLPFVVCVLLGVLVVCVVAYFVRLGLCCAVVCVSSYILKSVFVLLCDVCCCFVVNAQNTQTKHNIS